MVTDQQVKRLWRLKQEKLSLEVAAAKAGMDAKTARKYLRERRLPSEMKQEHLWRTRPDPFEEVWAELQERLTLEPGLQAKTLFEYLQRTFPAVFLTVNCEPCSGASSTGGRQKGHRGKCSSLRSIGLGSCASPTLRIAASWA